jgi:4-hydroxy-tetrahydrodipicolinate synthase
MPNSKFDWVGVFPATTTQFKPDLSLDLGATQRVQDALIRDGVHGLVLMGTVGENNSLTPSEKRDVLSAARETVGKRAPLIVGVSELTTDQAVKWAQDAEALGADGLMLLPAMVYLPNQDELASHFKSVARATGLPIMLYNNPPAYRVEITLQVLESISEEVNIEAIKESSPDTRRITDLTNHFGNRFDLLAGLDDVALEALLLGAKGWVSGLTNAFPAESLALFDAARRGSVAEALAIYRWFTPLLHLDAAPDLVQCIKLAEQIMGRGSERVRPPRAPLDGARRAEVVAMVERAAATRPKLSSAA